MISYLDYELLLNKEFIYVLRDLVDSAKRRIYIATYVASCSGVVEDIYYGIASKNKHGVDVKIVLNGASQEALKYNSETREFLAKLGIENVKLTKKFIHVKLYIVDDYFIIGSHNLSGSSFAGRQEISLMIRSKPMADKLSILFNEMIVREEAEALVYRDVVGGVYYEVLVNYRILRDIYDKTRLSSNRVKILVYIASLSKATTRYYSLLRFKQDEGVNIAVLLNGASKMSRRYNEPVHDYLKKIGIRRVLLSKDFIHSKLFIIDDTVVLGSHNLTAASIAGRLELSLAIKSRSLADALDYLFEHIWSRQEEKTEQKAHDAIIY